MSDAAIDVLLALLFFNVFFIGLGLLFTVAPTGIIPVLIGAYGTGYFLAAAFYDNRSSSSR